MNALAGSVWPPRPLVLNPCRRVQSVAGVVLLLGAMISGLGCRAGHGEAIPSMVVVVRDTISVEVVASGRFDYRSEAGVASETAGIVQEFFVEPGDRVRAGQALARVVTFTAPLAFAEMEAQAHATELDSERSRSDVHRMRELHARGFVSDRELEHSESMLQQAETSAALHRDRLRSLRAGGAAVPEAGVGQIVRSPIDGVVVELLVALGDAVVPVGSTFGESRLMVIAESDDLVFRGEIGEVDVTHLRTEVPVRYALAPHPEMAFSGTVEWVAARGRQESARGTQFRVRASVDGDAKSLKPGFSAIAYIRTGLRTGVLVIPERAVHFEGGSPYVWILSDGQSPTRRSVSLGLANGIRVEITEGLQDGDHVLINAPEDR